jgi:hypothetical protein
MTGSQIESLTSGHICAIIGMLNEMECTLHVLSNTIGSP